MASAGAGYIGSGISITFEDGGSIVTLERKVATFGRAIRSVKPAWEQIGQDLRNDWMLNFISEGALLSGGYGRTWAPLAPATLAEKRRLGYAGAHILERTGTLMNSLAFQNAPGNISLVDDLAASFGTRVPYARYHQTGAYHLPARRVVGVTRQRAEGIVRRLQDYIAAQIEQAGL